MLVNGIMPMNHSTHEIVPREAIYYPGGRASRRDSRALPRVPHGAVRHLAAEGVNDPNAESVSGEIEEAEMSAE